MKNEKSPEQFLADCIIDFNNFGVKNGYRFPQFIFNKLVVENPWVAENIVGTIDDFYYDDHLDGSKWNVVVYLWNMEG